MKRMSRSGPTVIDLFAGAGLFSAAFIDEGFRVQRAIEIDRNAAETYAANLGRHVEVKDVRTVRAQECCDVLIAGPPCQGFSTLNRRRENDPRNLLCLEVARWAKIAQPKVVVIENVAPFLKSTVWGTLASRLKRLGYEVNGIVLNAYDFGAPQLRMRSFTIASRIEFPDIRPLRKFQARTVREAWRGLPRRPNGRNLHIAPKPSAIALARMRVIPPGGDRRDVLQRSPRLAPPSWHRLDGAVTDVWGRMKWNAPSNTLRTALQNASKGRYIHPDQDRVISLREAARLHSIDDSWHFEGLPTHIASQIGNSVPPAVGRAVARAVHRLGND